MKFTKRCAATATGLLMASGMLVMPPATDTYDDVMPLSHGWDDTDVTRGDFLQVYSVNWENLPQADWKPADECAGDWRDLLHYMRYGPGLFGGPFPKYSPDLLLVQQIDGPRELDRLVATMTDKLDGTYARVIANRKKDENIQTCHTTDGHGNPIQEKDEQTNAIIYRTGRFEKVEKWGWQSGVWDAKDEHCENNDQDRTRNVAVRLRDKIHGAGDRSYYVTAASLHWPTARQNGQQCADQNWAEAVEKMNEPEDDELRILGGDLNIPDTESEFWWAWQPWYRGANGDLPKEDEYEEDDYRDVIYQHCNEPNKDGHWRPCLKNNWTFNYEGPGNTRRIDFLFAQADGGIGDIDLPEVHAEHTVTFNEGDGADSHVGDPDNQELSYSQHRAIRARIHYPF